MAGIAAVVPVWFSAGVDQATMFSATAAACSSPASDAAACEAASCGVIGVTTMARMPPVANVAPARRTSRTATHQPGIAASHAFAGSIIWLSTAAPPRKSMAPRIAMLLFSDVRFAVMMMGFAADVLYCDRSISDSPGHDTPITFVVDTSYTSAAAPDRGATILLSCSDSSFVPIETADSADDACAVHTVARADQQVHRARRSGR
jgi:hypothetical protein